MRTNRLAPSALLVLLAFAPARAEDPVAPGTPLARKGDEIVVAGQLFHTGTPVVLWTDPGGYDAYRVERRFGPIERAGWEKAHEDGLKSPARFGMRTRGLSPEEIERVRGGGWDLPLLQRTVDQFVIHYDVCGISRTCFRVLHDERGLSVHFMLDADGTIYQTLDLKESAWHATTSNQRSIGIEIAHMGAYPPGKAAALDRWYGVDEAGKAILTIPGGAEKAGLRNPAADLHPARNEPIIGRVQGTELKQYDYTDAQYEALIRLTATLCTVFPKIKCDYPRDEAGQLVLKKLPEDVYTNYGGLMGHYHVQTNKTDPGPAFDWDRLVNGARGIMKPGE